MPNVNVVVSLSVPVDPWTDPLEIELAVAEQARRAGRELYRRALERLDDSSLDAAFGLRHRLHDHRVVTLLGRVEVPPGRPAGEADGGAAMADRGRGERSTYVLSPGLRRLVRDLAGTLPARKIPDVCATLIGERVPDHAVWRTVRGIDDALR